jgi:tetratricopeptide (TPR) repeat protein
MKTFLLLLSFFWTSCLFGQSIKIGDNLQQEFDKIDTPYFFDAPSFTDWAEGSGMMMIASKPNPNECDYVFLALKDTTLIGAYIDSQLKILLDTEGNSILSIASDFMIIPEWAIKRHAKIDATDKTIYTILDNMYAQALQADSGDVSEEALLAYSKFASDTTLANRHIAILYENYRTIMSGTALKGVQPPPEICIPIINKLAQECLALYGSVPAIVNIYQGEALESAGEIDKARAHFKQSLQTYPGSIPILVYNYEFEQNAQKKKAALKLLKKKYPNHWMVKGL